MNWEDIERELGVSEASPVNGFLMLEIEDDEDEGRLPSIRFNLESPFCVHPIWVYSLGRCENGEVVAWGPYDCFEVDYVFKFMKEENHDLEPLDPSVLDEFPDWDGQERFVSFHGDRIRFENERCTFFFSKKFMWGNDKAMGFAAFILAGKTSHMNWQEDPIIFTFENAISWLLDNGYTCKHPMFRPGVKDVVKNSFHPDHPIAAEICDLIDLANEV